LLTLKEASASDICAKIRFRHEIFGLLDGDFSVVVLGVCADIVSLGVSDKRRSAVSDNKKRNHLYLNEL
jgi:hypothetical protein